MNTPVKPSRPPLGGGIATMALTCLLGMASYFFGHPSAIELSWFWMALGSLAIVALTLVQYLRARSLQRRDEELAAILDAVPHLVFFKDLDLRYRVLNAEFERIFHTPVRDALGRGDAELFGPALQARFEAQDRALMASGEAGAFEEHICVEGDLRFLQTRKRPVRDLRGRLYGIVGVAIDVTEQNRVQQQLEEANARLGIALQAARMGFWEWNLSTDEIRADERVREILGIDAADRDVAAVFARMHPEDAPRVRASMEDRVRNREVESAYEFRVVDPSGAVRWVEGFATLDEVRGGGDGYLIGINRDITARRQRDLELGAAKRQADRMLVELEQSRANLELALSVGELGVWQSVTRLPADADLSHPAFLDTVMTADSNIRKFCGHDAQAPVRYRDHLALLHPADRQRVADRLELTYARRQVAYRDQFRICGRDGVLRSMDVRGSLSRQLDPDGRSVVVTFTGIAKDATKEEALKSDLVGKAREARLAGEAKSRFLAMMSHEIRTPLSGVLGMLDLMMDTPLTDEQRGLLTRCWQSSDALLTIINDILDFSKIEAGMLDLERRPLSLPELIEDVCGMFRPEAARKSIGLESHVDAQLPACILGDPVRLRQVLTNLIGNAVKFTQHGSVKVEALAAADGMLQLAVQDTGIGIAPEAVSSLFEPFKQADVATTRRYGGTGLGLTIVKQLTELMQGHVQCESEVQRGSRFTVTVPLAPWQPADGAPPQLAPHRGPAGPAPAWAAQAGSETPGLGRRVLLAEDHPVNREVVTRQLAKLGYETVCAEDGEQAWDQLLAEGADYAVLLTDCHMPRLDGYQLAARVREREVRLGLPRLPIVALTANALQGEAERCLALGMDAYLSKPTRMPQLQQVLEDAIGGPTGAPAGACANGAEVPAPLPYPRLLALCEGDAGQVVKLLRSFAAVTADDLRAMAQAAAADDLGQLQGLAHRMRSACHQLDEPEAVAALEALESIDGSDPEAATRARALHGPARDAVTAVLARARGFIQQRELLTGARPGRREEAPANPAG